MIPRLSDVSPVWTVQIISNYATVLRLESKALVRGLMQCCECCKKMDVTKLHNLKIYNQWERGAIYMKFSDRGAVTGVEDARVVALFGNQKMGRFCTKPTWQAQ